jgi:dipeptidyl-peptidase 4
MTTKNYCIAAMAICLTTSSIAQKKKPTPIIASSLPKAIVNETNGTELLKLEDIFGSPKLFAKSVSELRSMKDGEHYSNTDDKNNIIKYEYKTGKAVDTIAKVETLAFKSGKMDFSFDEYTFSDDETKLLLSTETEKIFRHSTKSNYYVFDLKTQILTPVSNSGKQMYASFNGLGNMVAFVRENNIFLKNIRTGEEKAVTNDGKKNSIINGATDWVYEEEFSFDRAYQWNSTGAKIAYYRFDESRVKEFTLQYYDSLYPRNDFYKYPKAGEENSKVDIFIYDINTWNTRKADIGRDYEYIPRIKWTADENVLCIFKMNRQQNKLDLMLCDANTGKSSVMLHEENKSFIEINDDLTFLANKTNFIWTSSSSGYNHIYLYKMDGTLDKQITSGNYDITEYYGYSPVAKTFYYQAAEVSPMERQIYSMTMDGKKSVLSMPTGTNGANFSVTFKYFLNTYSAVATPMQCSVYTSGGKALRVLEDNANTKAEMKKYNLGKQEFFKFNNDDNVSLNGWMIKPMNFDATKKYPVLVFVYGGPGVQTVLNSWGSSNFFWFQMLAQKGYVVVSVDNRGTPGRGLEFANSIYKNLGHNEVLDQIALAKYLQQQSYVDAQRIGVYGWSYGGYMTSLLMTKGAEYFKTGIAVAPVTNWRYYDSIYTERYLQTPLENPKGYDENSPINFADKLKGKYLLIHGMADDNVHFQNAAEMVNALLKKKKQFDSFYYPNKAHGLGGMKLHVHTMMTDYILKNL